MLNPRSIILTLFRFYSKSIDCFPRFSPQHHLVNYLVGFWYFCESSFGKSAVMDSWCRGAARPLERNGAGETFGQRATFALAEATAVFNKRQPLSSHEASFNAASVNGSEGRDPDWTSALVKVFLFSLYYSFLRARQLKIVVLCSFVTTCNGIKPAETTIQITLYNCI